MKKHILVIIGVFFSVLGYGQEATNRLKSLEDSGVNLYQARSRSKIASINGSPYIIKIFSHAKVGTVIQNALVRYNACDDEFEFISSKGDTLVLSKSEDYADITLTAMKTRYQLVNFIEKNGKSNLGYLINSYEKDGNILYKRQKVDYYPAKAAKSSYETSTQARYSEVKAIFFIKIKDNEITELPSSKKGLLKLFPEKKIELETFLKQNDIDLEKEQDLMRLLDFFSLQ
ncbi:hypothetical protein [Flavobacterium sp.]|jgi:hypothetical protein|uniref:hypothetical protein n=1 Tax=Flavobacterium sp. TaxID=239 RepID=UPI0037C10890